MYGLIFQRSSTKTTCQKTPSCSQGESAEAPAPASEETPRQAECAEPASPAPQQAPSGEKSDDPAPAPEETDTQLQCIVDGKLK